MSSEDKYFIANAKETAERWLKEAKKIKYGKKKDVTPEDRQNLEEDEGSLSDQR